MTPNFFMESIHPRYRTRDLSYCAVPFLPILYQRSNFFSPDPYLYCCLCHFFLPSTARSSSFVWSLQLYCNGYWFFYFLAYTWPCHPDCLSCLTFSIGFMCSVYRKKKTFLILSIAVFFWFFSESFPWYSTFVFVSIHVLLLYIKVLVITFFTISAFISLEISFLLKNGVLSVLQVLPTSPNLFISLSCLSFSSIIDLTIFKSDTCIILCP